MRIIEREGTDNVRGLTGDFENGLRALLTSFAGVLRVIVRVYVCVVNSQKED